MKNLYTDRNWTCMLLGEQYEAFDDKDYLFEIKYDGIRAIIFVSPDEFTIRSRNNLDMTGLFPELKSIQNGIKNQMILDGEIVLFEDGIPSFSKLQERAHIKSREKVVRESSLNPVTFVCFDCIYDRKDLTSEKLIDRKKHLQKLKDSEVFKISRFIDTYGTKLFENIKKLDLEGIVAKEKASKYEINSRVSSWIKIKNYRYGNFLIGGYEHKKNGIISILLGEYRNDELYYVGNVVLYANNPIYKQVLSMKAKKRSPFKDFSMNSVNYILPLISVEVRYIERTKNNHLRQPVIVDKDSI